MSLFYSYIAGSLQGFIPYVETMYGTKSLKLP